MSFCISCSRCSNLISSVHAVQFTLQFVQVISTNFIEMPNGNSALDNLKKYAQVNHAVIEESFTAGEFFRCNLKFIKGDFPFELGQ